MRSYRGWYTGNGTAAGYEAYYYASYPTAILKSHAIPVLRNITPGIQVLRSRADVRCSVIAPSEVVAPHMLCSNCGIAWGL